MEDEKKALHVIAGIGAFFLLEAILLDMMHNVQPKLETCPTIEGLVGRLGYEQKRLDILISEIPKKGTKASKRKKKLISISADLQQLITELGQC
jgi:hypothetical protein